MRRVILAVAILLAMPAFAGDAQADPTSEDHDRARANLAAGRAKRASGDHAGALENFREAHRIEQLSTTGFEVGRTLVALGRLVEARELLSDIAKAPASAGEPPPLAAARSDARDLVDALERRIPTLAVKLEGPIDATVTATVDGVPIAVDLLDRARRLDPGEHEIVIRRGSAAETYRVPVAESDRREVRLKVPPASGPPAPRALTPSKPVERPSYAVAWVAGAIAVASATTGTIAGLVAIDKTDGLRPRCPDRSCPPDVHGDLETADTLAWVSTIGFTLAGTALAVAIWDLARPHAPSSVKAALGRALTF